MKGSPQLDLLTVPREAQEIWRVVDEHQRYEVSSTGRVRRGKRVLNAFPDNRGGYLRVNLSLGGTERLQRTVHALVLEAFVCARPTGMHANHKNGIKTDNRVENLEWVTPLENTRHARAMGNFAVGERQGNARLTSEDVRQIRRLHTQGIYRTPFLFLMFGISETHLYEIINRKSWAHI